MITRETKMTAIARIKLKEPYEVIASEMDIPLPLIKEWALADAEEVKSSGDLVAIAANIHAARMLERGEIIPSSGAQEELLKLKLEQVALDIVDQISLNIVTGDIVRAKSLQMCTDSVTKLYNSMVAKVTAPDGTMKPSGDGFSAFQSIMKD